jgi:nickel/cobalt exporter
MRRTFLILGLLFAAALAVFWAMGGLTDIERWAADSQREVQNAMAGAIRSLKAGHPGALAALLTVSFGYGFFHAVGPGHGKMLIGGYGAGSRVRFLPLAAIALASSLAQATTAVLLVYAGVLLLGWTRERMVGLAENTMAPLSYAAIAAIGLWLAWRGWRNLSSRPGERAENAAHNHAATAHDHGAHDHHGHVHDAHCGHSHGPTPDEVAAITGWRDALALIAGIAVRPCTGALFVLILTWQMGIGTMGVLAAYAMGLGTATVTLGVAALAVWAREGALASLPGERFTRAVPLIELGVGACIAFVATDLLIRAL